MSAFTAFLSSSLVTIEIYLQTLEPAIPTGIFSEPMRRHPHKNDSVSLDHRPSLPQLLMNKRRAKVSNSNNRRKEPLNKKLSTTVCHKLRKTVLSEIGSLQWRMAPESQPRSPKIPTREGNQVDKTPRFLTNAF